LTARAWRRIMVRCQFAIARWRRERAARSKDNGWLHGGHAMRNLMLLGCILTATATAAQGGEADDLAAVRKQGERYRFFLLKANKAGLEGLLHKDYRLSSLLGLDDLPTRDKAIAYWLRKPFLRLKVEVDSVRLFRDTAIETGSLSAELKEVGSKLTDTWGQLKYTRVWVREGKTWRLVHEHF
jgi:Domain of unknown function (DUF4440)